MSDPVGEQLTAWGKVAGLETTGRVTGRVATATVGFVETPDGAWLVASGAADADWALNLLAEPACRVRVGDRTVAARARELGGAERIAAIRGLILKYGTPAERLGQGPAFELRVVGDPRDGPEAS